MIFAFSSRFVSATAATVAAAAVVVVVVVVLAVVVAVAVIIVADSVPLVDAVANRFFVVLITLLYPILLFLSHESRSPHLPFHPLSFVIQGGIFGHTRVPTVVSTMEDTL